MGAQDENEAHRLALVPTSAVDIHHDWQGPGLLGTGSHTLSVKELAVAKDWTIDLGSCRTSRPESLYSLPKGLILSWALVGIGLGLAEHLGIDDSNHLATIEKDIATSEEAGIQRKHMAEAIQALAIQTKDRDMLTLATHIAFRL